MPLPAPSFVMAHGVLGLRDGVGMDPARDERFIQALQPEFANVISRQIPPAGMPVLAPHLVLASTSSQLAVSLGQLDFEVRLYGGYLNDLDRSLEYVERKLEAVRTALGAVDLAPTAVGLIATFHFSGDDIDGATPAQHIQTTLLRTDVDAGALQDAMARVAVKIRDTYFVTLTVANFESRLVERPIIPGLAARVRPWEGELRDQGIELAIDINNNLEGRVRQEETDLTETGLQAVTQMMRELATTTGPAFAETGQLEVAAIAASSRP
jgi:hypothetical protein